MGNFGSPRKHLATVAWLTLATICSLLGGPLVAGVWMDNIDGSYRDLNDLEFHEAKYPWDMLSIGLSLPSSWALVIFSRYGSRSNDQGRFAQQVAQEAKRRCANLHLDLQDISSQLLQLPNLDRLPHLQNRLRGYVFDDQQQHTSQQEPLPAPIGEESLPEAHSPSQHPPRQGPIEASVGQKTLHEAHPPATHIGSAPILPSRVSSTQNAHLACDLDQDASWFPSSFGQVPRPDKAKGKEVLRRHPYTDSEDHLDSDEDVNRASSASARRRFQTPSFDDPEPVSEDPRLESHRPCRDEATGQTLGSPDKNHDEEKEHDTILSHLADQSRSIESTHVSQSSHRQKKTKGDPTSPINQIAPPKLDHTSLQLGEDNPWAAEPSSPVISKWMRSPPEPTEHKPPSRAFTPLQPELLQGGPSQGQACASEGSRQSLPEAAGHGAEEHHQPQNPANRDEIYTPAAKPMERQKVSGDADRAENGPSTLSNSQTGDEDEVARGTTAEAFPGSNAKSNTSHDAEATHQTIPPEPSLPAATPQYLAAESITVSNAEASHHTTPTEPSQSLKYSALAILRKEFEAVDLRHKKIHEDPPSYMNIIAEWFKLEDSCVKNSRTHTWIQFVYDDEQFHEMNRLKVWLRNRKHYDFEDDPETKQSEHKFPPNYKGAYGKSIHEIRVRVRKDLQPRWDNNTKMI
ncbi:uncharacterized protein KY384_008047 [Bacidia gigantensis]|uniref:uncharacterized protein n=1 Tax=Bacidia gigantensis TaxID=2732470 RepID=UPI001D04EC02|nr:uncharacterized protein KY384_008047 [Bacidia gigantensis]KAG8527303.1 hypothetical protein KY384_008047 [Bacidia gigantensis]